MTRKLSVCQTPAPAPDSIEPQGRDLLSLGLTAAPFPARTLNTKPMHIFLWAGGTLKVPGAAKAPAPQGHPACAEQGLQLQPRQHSWEARESKAPAQANPQKPEIAHQNLDMRERDEIKDREIKPLSKIPSDV